MDKGTFDYQRGDVVTKPVPMVRIRIGHAPTLKGGWNYEDTVEYIGPVEDANLEEIREYLYRAKEQARQIGEKIRDARNLNDYGRKGGPQ